MRRGDRSRRNYRPSCETLEPRRVLATVLGVGTTALIGNDLTDPENDLVDDVNDGAGANFNWVSVDANSEPYFSPGGESRQGAFDVFDNEVGPANATWCCEGPEPEIWVAVELGRPYTLTHFTIAAGDGRERRDPDVWQIQGSNDGESWTTIYAYDQDGTSPFSERLQVLRYDGAGSDFTTPLPYHWFRYHVTSVVDRTQHQLGELELFGFSGLEVTSGSPAEGEIVSSLPEFVTVDFTIDVNPDTVQGSDLTIDGMPATSATMVDSDTIQFGLPSLDPGTHRLAIAEGTISPVDTVHSDVAAFSSTFIVPEPAIVENVAVTDLLADTVTIGAQLLDDRGTEAGVTIYWGTEDAETDREAWQNVIDLGRVNRNIYRKVIDRLAPETDYFYRAATMNAGGESWAPATSSFKTAPLTLPDLSVGRVDFVSSTAATIAGQVTDTGGDVPEVVVYYGAADGRNDPSAWQTSVDVGERLDDFATSISGLTAEAEYFYAAAATNSAGTIWSASRSFRTSPAPRLQISELMAINNSVLTTRIRADESVEFGGIAEAPDWIEIENLTDAPLDLSGSFLTDNPGDTRQWQFPPGTMLPANGRNVVFLSGRDIKDPALDEQGFLHTNFGLSGEGEYLALVSRTGETLFEYAPFPQQETDVSFGVANGLRQYFATPTPGAPNNPETLELAGDTTFSVDRGFYDEPIFIEIATRTPGATIHYTTDGSAPSETHGDVYTNPLLIEQTTTLRAVAFKPGMRSSNVDTQSYFFLNDIITQSEQTTLAAGFPPFWGRILPDYGMDTKVIGPNDLFEGRYAATIKDDLTSLPTLSIVTDVDNLFGGDGIYTNPTNSNLEVPTSIELVTADGSEEFQINAGIKIQGGAFRSWDLTKKKSFRLKFKSEYGPAKLNYPFFGPDATDEFDTITLRMEANDGWQWNGAGRQPQYARDEFGRRVQLAMGHPAPAGRFVHVYLNGVYWGMYNAVERPDQSFAESYLGSDKEDWDGINSGQAINAGDDPERRSRTLDAWRELVRLSDEVKEGETEADRTAALMRIQGLNPDGSDNPDLPAYLDVVNYIDYMIVNFYGGNTDWPRKNYYLGREHTADSEGFKFFMWDSEWSLFIRNDINTNVIDDPAGVGAPFQNLRFSESFRLLFADRVQKHLFNGGPLYVDPENPNWDPDHPERNFPAATYVGVVDENFNGLVAESARWGDQHRANQPYTRDNEWQAEFERLITEWFPQRTAKILEHFVDGKLFPTVDAPGFQINGQDQHGGAVSRGDVLTMPSTIGETTSDIELVQDRDSVRFLLPSDDSLEGGDQPAWTASDFDASSWSEGVNGVGYENRPREYTQLIRTDIRDAWEAQPTSLYLRYEFDLPNDFNPADFDRLKLRMIYDDGFVAYVNGKMAIADTVELPVNFDSSATDQRRDTEVVEFIEFQVDESRNDLQPGKNVLAIHGFNKSATGSDLLMLAELVLSKIESVAPAPVYFTTDGTDPRAIDGSAVGTLYTGPFELNETTSIQARALLNGTWSPLEEVSFVVNEASATNLLISEINYNPAQPTDRELAMMPTLDNDDFEFVEVHNPTDASISLAGLRFTDGIDYEFPAVDLGPGSYAVVVQDSAAFAARYGDQIEIMGEFADGRLDNGGERLTISGAAGQPIVDFEYRVSDPWPERADGAGSTLQLVHLDPDKADQFDKSTQWRGSTLYNGSPGSADGTPSPIVINEVITNTASLNERSDSIELHNTADTSIDIDGWYLSDSADDLLKFRIPDGTTLDAGGYIVFDETHFNPNPANPGPKDFALGGNGGDDVWLVVPDETGQVGQFVDDVHFTGTHAGQSLGRLPNGTGRLVPIENSLNVANSQWLASPVGITEVHYAPSTPGQAALAIAPNLGPSDLEFIELHNSSDAAVDLTNWRLRAGIDFDFPRGTMLGAQSTIVVISFNPDNPENADRLAALRAEFGIDDSVPLLGGFGGRLNNGEDLVKLQRPGEIIDPDSIPRILSDELLYDNIEPWPLLAAGESLHRSDSFVNGNASENWESAAPTPGVFDAVVLGDFTHDGLVDASDVNLLCQGVRDENLTFDLTGDGETSLADLDFLFESILRTSVADINLDGVFDGRDLALALASGEFEDEIADNSTWSSGDWNCDGEFTTGDIVRAFRGGNFVSPARAADGLDRAELASAISSMQPPAQSTSSIKLARVERKTAAVKQADQLENIATEVRLQLVDSVFSDLDRPEQFRAASASEQQIQAVRSENSKDMEAL